MKRSVEEIVQIAMAGGGVRLSAQAFPVDDLKRVAAAAGSGNGARVAISDTDALPTNELVSIATLGKGCVQFE